VSAQSDGRVENPANIQITNIVGSTVQPNAGFDPMASTLDTGGVKERAVELDCPARPGSAAELHDIIAAPIAGTDDEVLDPNPKLHRFRARRAGSLEVVVDVEALTHIIHVLIDNHSIVVTPKDLEDVLSYWGEPTVKTERVVVQSRGVPVVGGGCCACTDEQKEEVIETIKSIALNGLSLVKNMPDLLGFLGKLGLGV
jgi:hypothetical protein